MMGIVGLVVVFVMVFGGYMIAGGSMGVVIEALPHEIMTIAGGAAGAMIIGNTPSTMKALGGADLCQAAGVETEARAETIDVAGFLRLAQAALSRAS